MLALSGLYSSALYTDKIYGVLTANVVQVDPGLFVLIFVGVPVKAREAFAAASVHDPAATYVLVVVRLICDVGDVNETATNPEFASTIVPEL